MPAAVVVEVGAIEHLAPVFENGHQAAVIECLAEELLEEIDDPQSVDGGFDPQVMGGGHQLAARRNTQPLTILLELEDTYLAVLEAVPDQLVFGQLRRVPRRAMSRQVGRRCEIGRASCRERVWSTPAGVATGTKGCTTTSAER